MSEKVSYKDTLNLPKTAFPMKANLAQREPLIIKQWQEGSVYKKMVDSNVKQGSFIMPDGPPYANGNIHMGHTLNKCLKDFVIKYKNMAGYKAPFYPGWDCHGLPIEHKVTKELGSKRKDKTAADIRGLCRKEAKKWVGKQGEQFQRLGILSDWENPYLTLQPDYEAEEVRELARVLKNGTLYRGKKPVYWCYALRTALAEAEVEYADHTSPSIYVKFPFEPPKEFGSFDKKVYCVIWTTTPWTIPSNLAISLHPDLEYGFYDNGKEYWLVAKELSETVAEQTELELKPPAKFFKGSGFEKLTAKHPMYDRTSLFTLGKHVTTEAGTGCVHTAPGHGQDDYYVGMAYDLPLLSPVDDAGKYTSEVPEYEGQFIFDANDKIVADLKAKDLLAGYKKIKHSYPHCWRSKTPLIFRATSQWFIKMDDKSYNIRKKSLDSLADIDFVPKWGVKRLTAMIENRPDWCVSRQRNWGVPIPVFYCNDCEHAHMTEDFLMNVADQMEKNGGIEAYFEGSTEDLLGKDFACPDCGKKDWKKGTDILDVWFDSGICHAAVQKKREGLGFPADLYLEGSDQHRGWFQTSLISSVATNGVPPFKRLLTHNFVNDKNGRKMSKSLGNYVNPMDLVKNSGSELLRLWAASQDYGQDMNFSMEGFQRISESYRRFRNTLRFLLGNMNGFDHKTMMVDYADLKPIDKWALTKLNQLIKECTDCYDNYEFFKVYHLLNNFFTVSLSAHYLDILKDRLYTSGSNSSDRHSAQTCLFHIMDTLLPLMAPITSFLSEESYGFFSGKNKDSVFEVAIPKVNSQWDDKDIQEDFTQLFEIRESITKSLEDMRRERTIGSSLEAQLIIQAENETYELLKKYKSELCELFIVSHLELRQGELKIEASKATGEKCPRCWYISPEVAKGAEVCTKCERALA